MSIIRLCERFDTENMQISHILQSKYIEYRQLSSNQLSTDNIQQPLLTYTLTVAVVAC